MNQPVLEAKQIKKSFRNPVEVEVLEDITLTVNPGETVAIMGASGEGKSTLLHILGTLEHPSSGMLSLCGQEVSSSNAANIRNKHVGFIFQSYHLIQDDTALENVLMPARIARMPVHAGSDAYNRALHLLDTVGLNHRIHFPAKLLSGGEKQRVAIARALCNDPDLILADEPSGNLDSETSQRIHEIIFSFSKQHGKSMVVVTHDWELAALCDRSLTLRNGRLISAASKEELSHVIRRNNGRESKLIK